MKTLEELRKEIDTIDTILLETIAKRRTLVTQVGKYKKENRLPVVDKKREEEKLQNLAEKGQAVEIPASLISQIWKILYNDAYSLEEQL